MTNTLISALTISFSYAILIYISIAGIKRARRALAGDGNITFKLIYSLIWFSIGGLFSFAVLVSATSIPDQFNSLYYSLEEIDIKIENKTHN